MLKPDPGDGRAKLPKPVVADREIWGFVTGGGSISSTSEPLPSPCRAFLGGGWRGVGGDLCSVGDAAEDGGAMGRGGGFEDGVVI